MLCRTSKLVHPTSGVSLNTPLLVPSFSSKAFGFSAASQPEILQVLDASREFITKTCLISAYDVYYKYIPLPGDLPITVDLLFLDSGGYEVSEERDLSAVEKPIHRPSVWDSAKLESIVNDWPEWLPAVFVSYDHSDERHPVEDQLQAARQFVESHDKHLHSFLLKPETHEESTLEPALAALEEHIEDLQGFHLIGVTEKELGTSILDRMTRIAELRGRLDSASMSVPIHIFGALDPLSVCLYFIAGAEVFDGLTWYRYAYNSGQCVYLHNNAALTYGLDVAEDEIRVRTIKENLRYLDRLERSLRRVADKDDLSELMDHQDFVRGAADQLRSHLERSL